MKVTIFLMSILFSLSVWSQIPNGGFEDWEKVDNFERPLNWSTNQDSNSIRILKDTVHVEGQYSLKLVSFESSGWGGCSSYASTQIGFDAPIGEKKALSFFVKSIPVISNQTGHVYLSIHGTFFRDGVFDSVFEWKTFDPIETFKKIEIPIENPMIDSMWISIVGGAQTGAADGCYNHSVSWVDGMQITDLLTSTIQGSENDILVFPNPSTGKVRIKQGNLGFDTFELFDGQGKMVQKGKLETSDIQIFQKGIYMLKLTNTENRQMILKKILIQ